MRKEFGRLDLTNDGRITDDDLPPMMRGRDVLKGSAGSAMGGRGRMGGGQMGGGMMLGRIVEADANKDGVITLDEVLANAAKRFDTMDRNKDGAIDKADHDAMRKEMTDYRVKRFVHAHGADKEGKVTRDQFFATAKERFAQRDVNRDGRIDRQDFGMGDRPGVQGPGGPGGPGMKGPGGTGGQGPGGPGMGDRGPAR